MTPSQLTAQADANEIWAALTSDKRKANKLRKVAKQMREEVMRITENNIPDMGDDELLALLEETSRH